MDLVVTPIFCRVERVSRPVLLQVSTLCTVASLLEGFSPQGRVQVKMLEFFIPLEEKFENIIFTVQACLWDSVLISEEIALFSVVASHAIDYKGAVSDVRRSGQNEHYRQTLHPPNNKETCFVFS